MNPEFVRSQVYRLEQRPDSVIETTNFLKQCLQEQQDTVPRGALVYYLDELTKYVLNWIGKGDNSALQQIAAAFDQVLDADPEMEKGLERLSFREKFGANLIFIYDLISLYLRSDLELKDFHQIMAGGKVEDRLRELLLAFFKEGRRLNIADLARLDIYNGIAPDGSIADSAKKCIQRDLDRLAQSHLVRKVADSTKKVYYEATPRAYTYRDELQRRQKGDGWEAPKEKSTEKQLIQEMALVSKEVTGGTGGFYRYPPFFKKEAGFHKRSVRIGGMECDLGLDREPVAHYWTARIMTKGTVIADPQENKKVATPKQVVKPKLQSEEFSLV